MSIWSLKQLPRFITSLGLLKAMVLSEIKLVVREAVSEVNKSLNQDINDLRDDITNLQGKNNFLQAEKKLLRKANKDLLTRLSAIGHESGCLEQ